MFYWNLLEFVKFAILFWKKDDARIRKLIEVQVLLEAAELQRSNEIVGYYTDFPAVDAVGLWQQWMQGLLKSSAAAASHVANVPIDFWYAFRPGKPHDAVDPFVVPEAWWTL
jgi:hypothetical protein